MKKILFTILLILAHIFGYAQTPGLYKKVLYTMKPHEIIYYNEFQVEGKFDSHQFAVVLKDTLTNSFSFIFNGKKIAETSSIISYEYGFYIAYLDVKTENGFAIAYKLPNDKVIINIGGHEYGPFSKFMVYDLYVNSIFDYSFLVKDDVTGSSYIYMPGNKFGPYEEANLLENGVFTYRKNFIWFEYIYGKVYGGYASTPPREVIGCYENNYQGAVSPNGKKYISPVTDQFNKDIFLIMSNGTITGAVPIIDNPQNFVITNSGEYAYTFLKHDETKKSKHINLRLGNAISIDLYDKKPYNVVLSEENHYYAYCYEIENKHYVSVNNTKMYGPFNQRIDDVYISNSGDVKFTWGEEIDGVHKHYLYNSENKNTKVFTADYFFKKDSSGIFRYGLYSKNGSFDENGVLNNGNFKFSYPEEDDTLDIEINSPDKQHSIRSNSSKSDIIIDRKYYLNSVAFNVWYEQSDNCFMWNTVEGRDLVLYIFKL